MISTLSLPSIADKSRLHQILGSAYIDPFSNVLSTEGVEAYSRQDLIKLVGAGKFPVECASSFLHESTHHRCFDSPVGLAMMAIEGFNRSIWWKKLKCCSYDLTTIENCKKNFLCHNRALNRELLTFFAPLLEGTALYGELDAEPGKARCASQTILRFCMVFFYDQAKKMALANDRAGIFPSMGRWISAERFSGGGFVQTRELLATDQDEDWKKPYIGGYAWIKDIVAKFHSVCPQASLDTDATLAFICSYIFDDWQLADLIIQSSFSFLGGLETPISSDEIYVYLSARLANLAESDIREKYEEFDEILGSGQTQCSFNNFSYASEQRLIGAYAQAHGAEYSISQPKIALFRHVLRFGILEADRMSLNRNDGTVNYLLDGEAFSVKGLPMGFPIPIGDEEEEDIAFGPYAVIEFIIIDQAVYICFFFEGSLVACTDRYLNPLPSDDIEDSLGSISCFYNIEYWRNEYWQLLDPKENTTCKKYADDRVTNALQWRQKIFGV